MKFQVCYSYYATLNRQISPLKLDMKTFLKARLNVFFLLSGFFLSLTTKLTTLSPCCSKYLTNNSTIGILKCFTLEKLDMRTKHVNRRLFQSFSFGSSKLQGSFVIWYLLSPKSWGDLILVPARKVLKSSKLLSRLQLLRVILS